MPCMSMQSMQVVTFCTKYNTFNAMYVYAGDGNVYKLKCIQCHVCQCHQSKGHTHILAHNFLNIQQIFNPIEGLEC